MYKGRYPKNELPVDTVMKRFIEAMKNQEGVKTMDAIRREITEEQFVNWRDENGYDILHHAILLNSTDATDHLLKIGLFAEPYEPPLNPYAHMAARLGYTKTLKVVLTHRPGDFKVAKQPMNLPKTVTPIWESVYRAGEDIILPGIVGNAMGFSSGRRCTVKKRREETYFHVVPPGVVMKSMGVPCRAETIVPAPNVTQIEIMGTNPNGLISKTERFLTPEKKGSPVKQARADQIRNDKVQIDEHGEKRRALMPPYSSFDGAPSLNQTPLEVAALAHYPGCVKLMLDMFVRPRYPDLPKQAGYITLAVLSGCAPALKCILKVSSPGGSVGQAFRRAQDLKLAISYCMDLMAVGCLIMLLSETSVDVRQTYKPINFCHVLFMWSAKCKIDCNLNHLNRAVELMVKRSFPVSAKRPCRTYPLYTLLYLSFCPLSTPVFGSFMACMKPLLIAGVDPCFDEIEFEETELDKHKFVPAVYDRPPFHCALDCVLRTAEGELTGQTRATAVELGDMINDRVSTAVHLVAEYTEGGLNMNHVIRIDIREYKEDKRIVEEIREKERREKDSKQGHYSKKHAAPAKKTYEAKEKRPKTKDKKEAGKTEEKKEMTKPVKDERVVKEVSPEDTGQYGTVLHHYARLCVEIGVSLKALCSMIRHGADPNLKINGMYPLNTYFSTLFEKFRARYKVSTYNSKMHWKQYHIMLDCLTFFMTPEHLMDSIRGLYSISYGNCERARLYMRHIGPNLLARAKFIRPLNEIAAVRVWRLCGNRLNQLSRKRRKKLGPLLSNFVAEEMDMEQVAEVLGRTTKTLLDVGWHLAWTEAPQDEDETEGQSEKVAPAEAWGPRTDPGPTKAEGDAGWAK